MNWAQWECLISVPPGWGPCWRWLGAPGGAGIRAGSLIHTSGRASSRLSPRTWWPLTRWVPSANAREPGGGWGSHSPASEPTWCPSTLCTHPGHQGLPPNPRGRDSDATPGRDLSKLLEKDHRASSFGLAPSGVLCASAAGKHCGFHPPAPQPHEECSTGTGSLPRGACCPLSSLHLQTHSLPTPASQRLAWMEGGIDSLLEH